MAAVHNILRQLLGLVPATLIGAMVLQVDIASAQQEARSAELEEIIVTAQRREQSLQDVPIAIEVFSGTEIRKQGFRDMDSLANFSPTVLIEPRVQDQDVSIRGFGTTGNALTLDQATPFFVDGIHFGRPSQIKLAFLDVASIEVLKGPQPVYFGQNATAGAFNIRSQRPTASWQGYVNVELGSNSMQKADFGIGGPINDQWGIRVAATHEASEGFLNYVVTDTPYGAYENSGGRVMLQFTPNDKLKITGKIEAAKVRQDAETEYVCRTAGPLVFGRGGPLDDPGDPPGDERSVWGPIIGSAWDQPFLPLDSTCFDSNNSVSQGGPYYQPPQTIREENSNFGSVDMRRAADGFVRTAGNNGVNGYEDLDSTGGYLELAYAFDNEMSLEWLTGFSNYDRDYSIDNSNSPFLMNYQGRGEKFDQISSELRLRSATGGFIEWEIGAFHQSTDLEAFSSSLRANVRQSQRYNTITEEADYSAIFGTVTFNFLDDKLSFDIGGRYRDNKKFSTVVGYGASWIFAVCPEEPCDPGLTPVNVVFDPVLDDYAGCEGDVDGDRYCLVDPASARLFVPVSAGTLLYAMPYRESRDVPVPWISGNAIAVGLTAPNFTARVDEGEGPYAEHFNDSGFNPQLTVRFRASDEMTIYARYVEASKIGGFDTGQTSIPEDIDELTFGTEDAEQFEIGIKGTTAGGRFGYDFDVFQLEVPNLQVSGLSPDPNQGAASFNAGQRVRGLEFNTRFAATENLLLGFSGALLDGEMTSYPGAGCTDAEIADATTDPNAPCRLFDDDVRVVPPPDIDPADAVDYAAFIDRTGSPAPRTPEWKFVLTADYVLPLSNGLELNFNAKGYISDGYIMDVEGFEEIVKYDQHEDLNVLVGLRNLDKGWGVYAYARNLLEARPTYHPEADVYPNGLQAIHLSPSSFTTYGVKLEYLFD